MSLFEKKPRLVADMQPGVSDETIAEQLRSSAQHTAELAGDLRKRGWSVSVDIYPESADKGPHADVRVYRTQRLIG